MKNAMVAQTTKLEDTVKATRVTLDPVTVRRLVALREMDGLDKMDLADVAKHYIADTYRAACSDGNRLMAD